MGNFEKLSVLVIVVIIVMILVVALYTWTDSPDASSAPAANSASTDTLVDDTPPPSTTKKPLKVDRADKGGKSDKSGNDDLMARLFGGKDTWDLPKDAKKDVVAPPSPPPAADAEKPVAPSGPQFTEYVVKDGDTLGKIAQDLLGGTSKWPEIVKVNPGLDPMRMRAGQKLKIPTLNALASNGSDKASDKGTSSGGGKAGGTYRVGRGETLETIAKKVYGTKDKWPEIWVQNLNLLDDPGDIRADMTLQLPK